MKIRQVNLHGFKSFPDRTEIEFHDGVTAIVGPNGCGKSNISDAIRWVLGEQRPTAIRGSRMEEAIFEGTEERKPISRAEVELVLSNEDRVLPVPWEEVVFGRTVYRGGESEYRLNGEECRLRDIQDLCRDTGLGAIDYSVIEGGMIDVILSDRAEERRALFEEAAEIGRYKDRRRTALRRLEQAEGDLDRLEDVIGEVQTKVRSLAQQRGRAERYREYRRRRLSLELAVAEARLEKIGRRVDEVEGELEELREREPAEGSELSRRETAAETLRVEITEAERERARRAGRLEELRDRLEGLEKERIVAEERAAAAERRIEALEEELTELDGRRERLREEIGELEETLEAEREDVEELREREERLRSEARSLREERDRREGEAESARSEAAEIDREIRLLEAEREGGSERIGELRGELERRREALADARDRAREAEEAAGRAREELEELEERREELESRRAEAAEAVRSAREEARRIRGEVETAEARLSGDRARASSLESLLGSGEDLPPTVAALLEAGGVPGVRGVLADHLRARGEWTAAVEAHLGPYLHAVLVDDWNAVRSVREWLSARDGEEGLLLLPLDPGPRGIDADSDPSLLEAVEVRSPAREWARALLGGVDAVDGSGSLAPRSVSWAAPDGTGQDERGAVRLGQPGAGRGVLRRREKLRAVGARIDGREEELEELRSELGSSEERLGRAEESGAEAADALESVSGTIREIEGRRDAGRERAERASEEAEELAERVERLESSLEEAEARDREARGRLASLEERRREAAERVQTAERDAEEARERWEERRAELHQLQLELARRDADLEGAEERLSRLRDALRELEGRSERLAAERDEERRTVVSAEERAEERGEETAELLERRAELESGLREVEERIEERREALEREEEWLRDARKAEREHSERRHALELELAELRGTRTTILERIEGEWDEPLEALRERVEPPEEGGPAAWSEELEEIREKLSRLGPVNLLAAEEYEEEKERLDFLIEQREDLREARDDLHASIRRINAAAAEAFRETFEEIRENFERTFAALFEGGDCDLWLADDGDPLDSPIEISASPRGKRTQRIHLLSGGERALTALALLFAIYLAKPSPFCILDEVDAPLDETNVMRFVGMLERFVEDTQFIIITHNPRTIEAADWIYGVTMQEPGVSSVVGVELGDVPAGEVA